MISAIPGMRWPRSLRSKDPPLIAISWSWSAAMAGRYRARRAPGEYSTAMCFTPPMKFERRTSGSATRCMSGMRVEHLLEDELELHAGEVGAEAEVVAAAAERDLLRRARA